MITRLAKMVLGVLVESEEPVTRTRLMKISFLIRQETKIQRTGAFYDFVPYKYGPYSFVLEHYLHTLHKAGLVIGDSLQIPTQRFQEANIAFASLPLAVRQAIRYVVWRYRSFSDQRIIEDVYQRYPYYAHRSERNRTPLQVSSIEPAIYTIGYEGNSIDAFFDTLIRTGLVRVLDVRHNPLSRRYGFSKKRFQSLGAKVGIDYIHIRELGIPSEKRKEFSTSRTNNALFTYYEREILPYHPKAIHGVAKMLQEKPSVLLCYEADVNQCHRGRLAQAVEKLTSLPIKHLEITDV